MANKPSADSARIEAASSPEVPQFYFNGFASGITQGDIVVALERNGKPVAVLNMSYTVAKTLGVGLSELVGQFEAATGRTMLTTNAVDEAMKAHNEAPKT